MRCIIHKFSQIYCPGKSMWIKTYNYSAKPKMLSYKKSLSAVLVFLLLNLSTFVNAKDLIPIGKTMGMTLETDGIYVTDTAEFEVKDQEKISPAGQSGIKKGDRITKIDGIVIDDAKDFESILQNYNEKEVAVTIERSGEEKEVFVMPKKDISDQKVRLGVWIKDSQSGIGTITYIDPKDNTFGALGHGICDNDDLCDIKTGNLYEAKIASVQKGDKGYPGEIIGIFSESQQSYGIISKNTQNGIFGSYFGSLYASSIPTADRSEVTTGNVKILSNIEDNNICEYDAKITKINDDKNASRGMIIKITDQNLIEKTGGIVQGMSGSPIIQNGKLVGAVTHVFVNDPTKGYGIFIDNMLKEAENNE